MHALTREGVNEIHGENQGFLLQPSSSFISKTHMRTEGLGALKPVFILKLKDVNEGNDLLCPVTCLKQYLSRSAQYRADNQKQLFISWQRNCTRDIKPATISSYIKLAVILAYELSEEDTLESLKIVPHTVRHVATSLKAWRSFSLNDILEAGSWVSPNTWDKIKNDKTTSPPSFNLISIILFSIYPSMLDLKSPSNNTRLVTNLNEIRTFRPA